ncbi:MAG: NAD-dependent epimerase/dehydratase family protein [Candidatus Parcubacteria bacterium]|nr:NAD-dependent epimerase/dehydratase family protein [Candidatus Parcubacteria bacterium]
MLSKNNFPLVNKGASIKETMRIIDNTGLGVAFVIDENKSIFGAVTDGDIRRAILKGVSIEKAIESIANTNPIIIREDSKESDIQDIRARGDLKGKISGGGSLKVPVIDEERRIKDIVFIYKDKEYGFGGELNLRKEGIKKVLVLGGAGYLGSVLCRELLNEGYKVRVLDNLSYGDDGISDLYQNKNFEFKKGDIRDISNVVDAIGGMDAVIHLAAIVGDPACAADSKETLEINYFATKNIIETCKYFQINRLIFASTCSVYGQNPSPDEKLTENSPLNPVSLYAETKIRCERAILGAMDENFSPIILRMATLYGYSSNMRFDLAVNFLTARAMFDKKMTIFGGEQWRPWLHLKDAAQVYITCLKKPLEDVRGQILNVLSENYRVFEVGNIINSICPEATIEISEKAGDKRNYNVSSDKIARILDYRAEKKLVDGVNEIKEAIASGIIKGYKDPKYRTAAPQI